jgi:hypothetical protein
MGMGLGSPYPMGIYPLPSSTVEHTLSSRVVPVNEEVNVVEPVPEKGQSPLEVGFDIYGTSLEPEIPVDQGKPRMHLTLP